MLLKMKITYSENYNLNRQLFIEDVARIRRGESLTYAPFSSFWKEKEVTFEELQELVNKGYAIKINC